MEAAGARRWRTLALVEAAAALGLVVAGSLVNSQQAALSVPDWPLSYGRPLLTHWPGGTAWEQLHRLAAAINLALTLPLALALRRQRRPLRRLAGALLGLLLLKILLGGVVVLTLDPPAIAALHVVLAHAFAATALLTWWATRPEKPEADALRPAPPRSLRLLPWLLGLQIVLGALSRHPPGMASFIVALVAHSLLGLAVVGLAIGAGVGRLRRGARAAGWLLLGLAVAQLGVAAGVFLVSPEPLAETWPPPAGFPALHAAHHLLAALLLGTAVVLRRREPAPALPPASFPDGLARRRGASAVDDRGLSRLALPELPLSDS